MRRIDTRNLDFKLPQVCISPLVGPRVRTGSANLLALPMAPQPTFTSEFDDASALEHVRYLFQAGHLREVIPLPWGRAFGLVAELPGEKIERVGTAIVLGLSIKRLDSLATGELVRCGYESREDFTADWERSIPEAPALLNPWVWLIRFEYKGVTLQ